MPAARTDSPFRSGGLECAAWLYQPEGQGPHPCVVMAHGFSAVREQRLDAYAERFAAAGLAVLVFDYRHFGASQGEPRQLLSIARQLADWRAAVAHARNLPDVDPRARGRLGLVLQRRPRGCRGRRRTRPSPRWSRRPRSPTASRPSPPEASGRR